MRVSYICSDGKRKFTLTLNQDRVPMVGEDVFIPRDDWNDMRVVKVRWFPYNIMNNSHNNSDEVEVELELLKLNYDRNWSDG